MKKISIIIWDICSQVILTIIAKNPCSKKCLVKACCTDWCEVRLNYNKLCDFEGNIKFQRACASIVAFTVLVLIMAAFHIVIVDP